MGRGQGLEHIECGGHVHLRGVQGLIDAHAVDLAEVAQAAFAAAVAVHGPVQDQRVGDGPQLAAKAGAHRGQPVASELGLHECEVVGGVEGDDRGAGRHRRHQVLTDLCQHLGHRPSLGAGPLGGHAVDRGGGLGDLHAGVCEPRGHRLRPDAVGPRSRPPDERRRDQTVAGRVHSGGLSVEAEQGAEGPGGGNGGGGVGHGGGVRGAHGASMPPGCDINAPVPVRLGLCPVPPCAWPPRRSLRWIPDRPH